jgi:hypothetical protein
MVSATSSTPAVDNTITLFSGTTSAASAVSFAQQLAATLAAILESIERIGSADQYSAGSQPKF